MKKTIFLMLGMAAMLASCSQDELETSQGAGTAVITATVDDGIATRSTYDTDDVDITRCLLEVRDAEGNLVGKQHEMTEGTDGTYTFTVRGLNPKTEYTYVFWADNGSAYDAEDLTDVTQMGNSGDVALAFSGTKTGKPGEISATLKHAVAKITLKTTGSLAKGDMVYISTGLSLNTLNVLTGEVENGKSLLAAGGTRIEEDIPAEGGEVMTVYVPMPADGQTTDVKIKYICAETGNTLSKTMTNVPLRANYRTLISGDIGNIGATDVTATLTTGWNDNEPQEFVRYEINLEKAGTLTDEMIDKAIAQNGRHIVIKGKVNQTDIDKLVNNTRLNIVSIDMSNATLDDQNKAWPWTYTGVEVASGGALEAVVLPEGIESLANSAFQDQTNLKTIKLPSTLVSIGDNAFQGSRLTEITIPEGVTTIGYEAFRGAHLSGELTIPKNVTSIGYHAFDGITKITSLVWNTNLTLSKEAFSFCPELTTVTINGNVSSFDAEITVSCQSLKTVTFTSVTAVPEFAGNDLSSFGQVKIYVPESLVDAFKAADGWSQFADNIFPLQ